MYKYTLLLALSLGTKTAPAQTAELQQLTLDLGKLSQLKSILQDMLTYYTILDKGYEDIKGIARGNFGLHQTFLNGLLSVSAAVSGDPRVAAIVQDQLQLLQVYQQALTRFRSDPHLTPAELAHLSTFYTNALSAATEDLDELSLVLTPGTLRMSDDERLTAINRVHLDLRQRLTALTNMTATVTRLSTSRTTNAADALTLQKLIGQ